MWSLQDAHLCLRQRLSTVVNNVRHLKLSITCDCVYYSVANAFVATEQRKYNEVQSLVNRSEGAYSCFKEAITEMTLKITQDNRQRRSLVHFLLGSSYLLQRLTGVVFRPPFVCLSVSLFVNSITQKAIGGFYRNLGKRNRLNFRRLGLLFGWAHCGGIMRLTVWTLSAVTVKHCLRHTTLMTLLLV